MESKLLEDAKNFYDNGKIYNAIRLYIDGLNYDETKNIARKILCSIFIKDKKIIIGEIANFDKCNYYLKAINKLDDEYIKELYEEELHYIKADMFYKLSNFEVTFEEYKFIQKKYKNEKNEFLVTYLDMLLKNNKVDKAIDVLNEFRPNNEHFAKEEERINNEIQRLQEKDLFQKELQLSEMGNLQSIKYIADTYYHGNSFVKTDHNKALEYYEIYYEKTHDNETKKIINELVPSYRTGDYEFVKTKNIPSVDIDGNVIYYLINYYSTKSVEISRLEDRNDYKERAHDAIIAVKNSHYVENHSNYTRYFDFPKYVCNFINMLEGKWIICTVPGHKQSLNFTNGTIEVFDLIDIEGTNFTIRNTVIWRNKWVNKKATSFHGRRCMDYKKEMESLSIENGYDVRGKNFIIVDDITTSGTSLIACRNLLLDAGANKCILLAYGKTKEN